MAGPPSIVPSLSARFPRRCPRTHEYLGVYSENSSRPPRTMAVMTWTGADRRCVVESSGRGVMVKSRGGITCRGLPIGGESGEEQA